MISSIAHNARSLHCRCASARTTFVVTLARLACLVMLGLSAAAAGLAQQPPSTPEEPSVAALHEAFAHPPDDCKIMMRWWWFGPAAAKPELKRELEQMKAAGIGGVEIATLYPLALDDPANGFHNYPFVSDEHIDALRYAAVEARRLGLRVDVTLGSGWPFGGAHIPVTQAAGSLRVEAISVSRGSQSVAVPALEAGEQFIGAFLTSAGNTTLDMKTTRLLHVPTGKRLDLPGNDLPGNTDNDRTVLFFIASRTGMMVKRPAEGAAGFVLDHYDSEAIDNHLHAVGDRLLSAFDGHPPYAVFSDSLEDYGSNWTPNLLAEFQRRRGYDLTPLLPALVRDIGPDTSAVRHDWGQTLTELANDNFLKPMHAWAQQHHTLLRSQTYGFPPVTLSSNRYEDLPEGEGKATVSMWREFSDTRWAASAGHLFNHPVISSETWTWLHSPAFRATPLDMKAEADLHFLQGINQLVGHGWPYSPETAGEPGWRMYAAGAFNAHNPWFAVMPDLSTYLQRVSFVLRQGKPANDVALLLPNDDVWASFTTNLQKNKPPTSAGGFDETGSNNTIDESMPRFLGTEVISQVLDAGFNLDFIDADAIDSVGIPYKALILPGIDRLSPGTYQKVMEFAQKGGIVIATKRLPATAPGLIHAADSTARIQSISQALFHGQVTTAHFVPEERNLGAALAEWLKPDFVLTPRTPEIGFIRRHLDKADVYFIANTGNEPQNVRASFRSSATHVENWDPFSGKAYGVSNPKEIALILEPYESRILFFSDAALTPATTQTHTTAKRTDLTHNWKVTFSNSDQTMQMSTLSLWSDNPHLRYYSGRATYRKTIDMPESDTKPGHAVTLDFGEGTPIPKPSPLPHFNMRAYLESPVREAAQVFVNDQLSGYVWHPPYRLELSPFVKSGKNELRIEVGNTAINQLAGESIPNYRLLYDRFGKLFEPQDMQNLSPLPSGITGRLTLVEDGPVN